MFIVKKIAEIGEGITIVFGVMKGEGYGLRFLILSGLTVYKYL
jgi:hypothetical protein